jgi:hypothetical protein
MIALVALIWAVMVFLMLMGVVVVATLIFFLEGVNKSAAASVKKWIRLLLD